jgi:hypothetical protein
MQVQCSWRWVLPGHFDRVAAAIIIPFRTVEWLVNVAKKVHEKTERIVILAFLVGFISAKRVFGRSFQKHYEVIDRKDDAVTLACGATVVSILRKVTVSFHGYVYEVPKRCLGPEIRIATTNPGYDAFGVWVKAEPGSL